MSLIEGVRVSYIGDGQDRLELGDRGKVLSSDGEASHVLWMTGSEQGKILFVDDFDLSPDPHRATLIEDALEASLVSFGVRETFDRQGQTGLFNAMNDEGHMASMMPVAEEAIALVVSRMREDPSFREVLSHLDSEDGDDFIFYATVALLRDACGEDDI